MPAVCAADTSGGGGGGGQAFRPDLVPAFLEHPDWKYRHAALCCISQARPAVDPRGHPSLNSNRTLTVATQPSAASPRRAPPASSAGAPLRRHGAARAGRASRPKSVDPNGHEALEIPAAAELLHGERVAGWAGGAELRGCVGHRCERGRLQSLREGGRLLAGRARRPGGIAADGSAQMQGARASPRHGLGVVRAWSGPSGPLLRATLVGPGDREWPAAGGGGGQGAGGGANDAYVNA